MATHSSVLACKIPWTKEPGGLLSMGWHRVGHDLSDLAAAVVGWKIISFAYCIIITKEKEWYQDKTEAHYPMFQREEINHSRNCPHVKFQISVKESESHSVVSTSLKFFGHSPWNSLGQNTGVGSLFLLQGIFPSQGSSPGLLHCRWMFYQLSHQGSPSAVLNQWLVII